MEGVTILNTFKVVASNEGGCSPKFVLILFFAVLCITSAILGWAGNDGAMFLVGLFATVILSLFAVMAWHEGGAIIYETRYEAIIDEDVKYFDLIEYYDILEKRGDIFILRDKEKGD